MKNEDLLRFLKDNQAEYLSGEDIAERMGVSRTAVWNHIQELRLLGYEVEAVPHRGYQLVGLPDRLLADEMQDGLDTKCFGKKITVYEKLASTNDTALSAAQAMAPEGAVYFAEVQSKGRGRLGRNWHCPRGKGLLFSVVLRPRFPMGSAPKITLTAAVGVAKALREATGLDIQIKWPNDLYWDGKKLGGILTEMETDLQSIRHAVLGIGINVNAAAWDLPADLKDKAVSLRMASGIVYDRNVLARTLLEHLEVAYDTLVAGDFEEIRREWMSLSLTTGRWVEVVNQRQKIEGVALGVDENGCLIVRQENGLAEHVFSGDVLWKK